jgi:hypothetical protein
MKRGVFIMALATIALGACSKETSSVGETPASEVQSFSDLNVPQGFDFSGTKTVQIRVPAQSGLPDNAKSLLTLKDESGNAVLKYNVQLSKGLDVSVQIPASAKKLYAIDGYGFKHEMSIQNNQLILNTF